MKNNNPVNQALTDIDKDQNWLAKQVSCSRPYTNRVINGKHQSWRVRRKIARVLGKPENELFPEQVAM